MEEEEMKTVWVGVSNEKEMGRNKSAESKS
jgi:hypothetical protein